jgi:transposase
VHRHAIESPFARIKSHHRSATRYEKLAVTFLDFVPFAAVLDWLTHEV